MALPGEGENLLERDMRELYAEEITAWRAWKVELRDDRLRLISMNSEALWPYHRWAQARCSDCGKDVPGEECACGIYALKTRELLLESGYAKPGPRRAGNVVFGEVGLAGKVIPADDGYRAQLARPRLVYVPFDHWTIARDLRRLYRGVRTELWSTLHEEEHEL